jgi:hypothetical protein
VHFTVKVETEDQSHSVLESLVWLYRKQLLESEMLSIFLSKSTLNQVPVLTHTYKYVLQRIFCTSLFHPSVTIIIQQHPKPLTKIAS